MVDPSLELKREFMANQLSALERDFAEYIAGHPIWRDLPEHDQKSAAHCAAQHFLLAMTSRRKRAMTEHRKIAEVSRDFFGSDGGPLPKLQGRARQFDDAWNAVISSDELAIVRRRLSIHELRTLIELVIECTAEP